MNGLQTEQTLLKTSYNQSLPVSKLQKSQNLTEQTIFMTKQNKNIIDWSTNT